MKNYEEKEKKLDNVLKRLNSMSNKVIQMNNDINSLKLEKNQLLGEKEESERNFHLLSQQHQELKSELEKINKDVRYKFGNQNNFSQKIDELNQETETLIEEIEKWQT
ncbi:MAG TPA: 5-formyltetrahydrofolate cyclo-ligase [Pelagibacteraceae bacterium]|jgi:5-formyltetrahydrofolate cyclo-ligase|nr:5-formyltetrahydrofolate cyclo-ligase [Pelagibacteraceae bacterium]|tara:strand:- start:479 stop:802 length:324 start_codon:yes stop_codon:yes gene_type:complete